MNRCDEATKRLALEEHQDLRLACKTLRLQSSWMNDEREQTRAAGRENMPRLVPGCSLAKPARAGPGQERQDRQLEAVRQQISGINQMENASIDPGSRDSGDAPEKVMQNMVEPKDTITRAEKILAYTGLVLGCVSFFAIVELGILFLRNLNITWIDAAYAFLLRAMLSIGLASLSGFLSILTGAITLARMRDRDFDTQSKDERNLRLASIWGIRLSLMGLTVVLLFFIASFLIPTSRFL